ncbi:hypothetical protein JCM9279_007404 [Rhodotorula babjevae]
MHGVKRSRVPPVPDSEEVARRKRDKELQRIDEYRSLLDGVLDKDRNEVYTHDALADTTRLLSLNPEFQTGWGVRRRILLKGLLVNAPDADARQQLLEADLQLTNASLKLNPKVYCVWEHRKWVLETMPDADWGFEFKMVEMYLEKDARNFHSWDYRRYLVSSIQSIASPTSSSPSLPRPRTKPLPQPTTSSELAFTTRKISANFSNFSAWHYRTKLLQKLWDERGWAADAQERLDKVDEEFELVKQAIWSDPNDQSAWLYHRWLVGDGTVSIVRREIEGIEELLEEEPDSRWCLDSLVHYKRLLVRLLEPQGDETRPEREELNLACVDMLARLKEVDPMRRARYDDLSSRIVPTRSFLGLISTLAAKHSTPQFGPHVTLLSGIPSSAELPPLLDSLRAALAQWRQTHAAPLRLAFTSLGSKAAERVFFQYLFAHVDNSNEALVALRQATRNALLSPEQRAKADDYMPHLSLMYGEDDERKAAQGIMDELRREGGEVRRVEGEGGAERCAVSGHEGIEVDEVQVWRCEGPPEAWQMVASERL